MKKWWILLIAFSAWTALGVIVPERPQGSAASQTRSSQIPSRIVSMAPDLTEILFALGLSDDIVGVTQDSDYPLPAMAKPKVGTFWQPNIEAVIALKPDLVVTQGLEQQRNLADRLTRLGYRCLTLDIRTVNDLFEAISAMAAATGRQQQAQQLLDRMRARIAAVRDARTSSNKVRVLWVVQRDPLRVAGTSTFIDELIELAGGKNAIGPTMHQYPSIGGEQVIASVPQVIIEPAMTGGNLAAQRAHAVSYWNRYATVPAVANGRIYVIDGSLVSRLSPRLPDGIELIARCLRPQDPGE